MNPIYSMARILFSTVALLLAHSSAFSGKGTVIAPRNRPHHPRQQTPPILHWTTTVACAATTTPTTNLTMTDTSTVEDCPAGYYLDSVKACCEKLGPLGRVSQAVETAGPFQTAYRSISNLFGLNASRISSLGVAFALSYSILSQINGAITLSAAWYLSCKRVRVCIEECSQKKE